MLLHRAVECNALDDLKALIKSNVDLNIKNEEGNTILHTAALHNSLDIFKYLLEFCKMDLFIFNKHNELPQHFAAKGNALEVIKYLKSINIDLAAQNVEGKTLLHTASLHNSMKIVKYLAEDGNISITSDDNGNFPQHCAAEGNALETMKYLKTLNADLTVQNNDGNTLLHIACLKNAIDVLKFLIENCKIDLKKNKQGSLPQHYAARGNALHSIKYLNQIKIDFTVTTNIGNTLLHVACLNNSFDVLKYLIEDCKMDMSISNKKGRYPQHFAALADEIKLIKYLKSLNIDLTVQDNNGDTLLHFACLKNHLDFIKFLIEECKMDLSITNKAGYSAQHFAAHGNALDVMKYLKTQNVDLTAQDNNGDTLVHIACESKALDVLKFLMEDCGMDLSISNKNGQFAQHLALDGEGKSLEIIKYLKTKDVDLTVQNNEGNTLMHYACIYKELDVIKFLIEDCKMDLTSSNEHGYFPQHFAVMGNNALEVIKYLKTVNVDLTVQTVEGNTLINCACESHALEVLKFLIEDCKLDYGITNIYGQYPQHLAARRNAMEIMKYFKTLNVDFTVQTLIGDSLLHVTCIEKALDALIFLIEVCKLDLRVTNNYGHLAQHFAARGNAVEVMKYLKTQHVDLRARDNNGDTVMHFACKQNCLDVLKFLIEDCEMDFNLTNEKGRFPQHSAAQGNALEVTKYLKTLNVDLYVCDHFGHTLLHDASMKNSIVVFTYLIEECSLDLDVRTKDGSFPQHAAARSNAVDIMKYLKNKNFNLKVRDYNGNTIHHKAAMGNAVDMFKYLIEECDMGLNVYNKDGSFPQLEAAKYGSLDVIKYFKILNVDFGVKDYNGNTMLHKACMTDSLDVVKYLLEECNMELVDRNSYGEYPQHHAAIGNALDVLKYFKEKNLDLNVRDNRGNTLLHKLSSTRRSLNVRKFLIEECNMSFEVYNNRGESRRPREYTNWRS